MLKIRNVLGVKLSITQWQLKHSDALKPSRGKIILYLMDQMNSLLIRRAIRLMENRRTYADSYQNCFLKMNDF